MWRGLFKDALHRYRQMEALPWIAWTQAAHARVLLDRDRPGDSARAADLIDQALATARDLGMTGFEARLTGLQGRCYS